MAVPLCSSVLINTEYVEYIMGGTRMHGIKFKYLTLGDADAKIGHDSSIFKCYAHASLRAHSPSRFFFV